MAPCLSWGSQVLWFVFLCARARSPPTLFYRKSDKDMGGERMFRGARKGKEKPSGRKVSTKINLDLSNIKSFFKYRI